MPSLDDHERRIRRLEGDVADLKRRHNDLDHEKDTLFESIKGWVSRAMTAALEPFHADIEELKSDQKQQLEMLREAAEERGRRKQREEDEERRRRDHALQLETKKVDVDEMKTLVDGKVRSRTALLVFLGVVATAIGSAIAGAIASHH